MTSVDRHNRRCRDMPLVADSGYSNDELHVVQLRGAPGGVQLGLIKGERPQTFIWRSVQFRRSTFTHRQDDGSLSYTYFTSE